jgi:hypothetical protein
MKIIDVPKDAAEINALLDQARGEDLVLRTADGAQFMLTEDFEDEIRRTRKNKRLMALLEERGREAGTIPLEQIERELGLLPPEPGDHGVE